MRIFFFLALVGLILSAAAHFSTYLGVDPQERFPYIWLLHIGIFVVCLPAFAIQGMLPRGDGGKFKPFEYAPKWMRLLMGVAFIYAIVNFVIFIFLMSSGSPYRENGRFVLKDHGKLVRQITEQEYHQYKAYEVRGFSGHWMLFYAAALTMLASGIAYREMGTNSGLSATIADDGRRGKPLWVHTVFAVMVQAIGFFFLPAIFIVCLMTFHLNIGCCGAVLWLATPWPGLGVALYLLQHKLPGVCPMCGGRAYWVSSRGTHYRCADCNWMGG
jgi:hypothetical protein